MSTTYGSIIDKAEILLQDEDSDQTTRRWTETELLGWALEAEHEIVKLKPDSYPVISVVQLSAGSQQSIPSDAIQLLDVLCNMSTDGTTRGDIISVVDKRWMNAINPGWMADTANTTVTHVIYDSKRAPALYWVYPKSAGNNYIEIMSATLPANSAKTTSDNILLRDEYATPIKHYILAMAFLKDTDIPQSDRIADKHMNFFLGALGRREQIEEQVNPRKNRGSL